MREYEVGERTARLTVSDKFRNIRLRDAVIFPSSCNGSLEECFEHITEFQTIHLFEI